MLRRETPALLKKQQQKKIKRRQFVYKRPDEYLFNESNQEKHLIDDHFSLVQTMATTYFSPK